MSAKQPDVHPETPIGFVVRMPSEVHRELSNLSHRLKMQRGRKGHRTVDPLSANSLILDAVKEYLQKAA